MLFLHPNNFKRVRRDKNLLVLVHISGLLTGFIVPLVLWSSQREEIIDMESHGKASVNFQLTSLLYFIIAFMFGFMCCLGFITIPFWFVYAYLFPIISAVNASNDKEPYYPLTIKFIS